MKNLPFFDDPICNPKPRLPKEYISNQENRNKLLKKKRENFLDTLYPLEVIDDAKNAKAPDTARNSYYTSYKSKRNQLNKEKSSNTKTFLDLPPVQTQILSSKIQKQENKVLIKPIIAPSHFVNSFMKKQSKFTIVSEKSIGLHYFDDNRLDFINIDKAISMLEDGPVDATSIFYDSHGNTIWKQCKVYSYNNGLFSISFDGKIYKNVHRISIRFFFEDEKQFHNRRHEAQVARDDYQQEIQNDQEISCFAASLENEVDYPIKHNYMKLIPQRLRPSPIIPKLLYEIESLFAISEAQEILSIPHSNHNSHHLNSNPRRIREDLIYSLNFPSINHLVSIQHELIAFLNIDFLCESLPENVNNAIINDVFNRIEYNIRTMYSYASGTLFRRIFNISFDMVKDQNNRIKDRLLKMVECRLINTLTQKIQNEIVMFPTMFSRRNIRFSIIVNEKLKIISPNADDIIKKGKECLKSISRLFLDNRIIRIKEISEIEEFIDLYEDEIILSYDKAISKWENMVLNDFGNCSKLFNQLLHISKHIPETPLDKCIELLPSDSIAVLLNCDRSTSKDEELHLENIKNEILMIRNTMKVIHIEYSDFIIELITFFDIKPFIHSLNKRYQEYESFFFRYLGQFCFANLDNLKCLIQSLDIKSKSLPSSVEEWNEKNILIEKIENDFQSMNTKLDFVYEVVDVSNSLCVDLDIDYTSIYEVKRSLIKFFKSVSQLRKESTIQRISLISIHENEREVYLENLNSFLNDVYGFHFLKDGFSLMDLASSLDLIIQKFELINTTGQKFIQRDEILRIDVVQYEQLSEIAFSIDIFKSIFFIARAHETQVEGWLSAQFTTLDVDLMTNVLIQYETDLNNVEVKLKSVFESLDSENMPSNLKIKDFLVSKNRYIKSHPLLPIVYRLLNSNKEIISYIPIVKELCNSSLRSRHWYKISQAIGISIDKNDSLTWHWLIESRCQDKLQLISSISNSARKEFQIEKSIQEMCDELLHLRLISTKKNGILKLDDPSSALELLARHRQKMQEIFLPPYVQPFVSKITEYEVLANNLKVTLKQTLMAEKKLEELHPAIRSDDISKENPKLMAHFKDTVNKFNTFASDFKLSLSFHQIVSNQKYVELTRDLNVQLDTMKNDLLGILKKKREYFPRFYFLSDTQLVQIISNSRSPSSNSNLFSIMYPSIKEAIIEDELFCIGFRSHQNEEILFSKKIWINRNSTERWHKEFDDQISVTLQNILNEIMESKHTNIEKLANMYPTQIVQLYFEILFTSRVTNCLESAGSVFTDRKETVYKDLFNGLLSSIDFDIDSINRISQNNRSFRISNLRQIFYRHRLIAKEFLDEEFMHKDSYKWLSKLRYYYNSDKTVDVKIANVSFHYSFQFTGSKRFPPIIGPKEILFTAFAICINNEVCPLFISDREIKKAQFFSEFSMLLGKETFVYPCVHHSTYEKINNVLRSTQKCSISLILKDIIELKDELLNEITSHVLSEKHIVFGTYSTVPGKKYSIISEQFRLLFKIIEIPPSLYGQELYFLVSSAGAKDPEILVNKILSIVPLVENSFTPPISHSLSLSALMVVILSKPFDEQLSSNEEFHLRLVQYLNQMMGVHDLTQIFSILDKTFGNIPNVKQPTLTKFCLRDYFVTAIENYNGIIVLGDPISGKSSFIKDISSDLNAQCFMINPNSMTFSDLYGSNSSGIMGSVLQEGCDKDSKWIVFDGTCSDSWMDVLLLGMNEPRKLFFFDGSMMNVSESTRFIFETSNISNVSPTIIAQCATIHIDLHHFSLENRISHFLLNIGKDQRIVEPISGLIVGSSVHYSNIEDIIRDLAKYFIDQIILFLEKNSIKSPLTTHHYLNNFFNLIHSFLVDYYYIDTNISMDKKGSADDMVKDLPNITIFCIFWCFASPFSDDIRRKIDGLIHSLIASSRYNSIFNIKRRYLNDIYFNTKNHIWEEWNHGLSADLFFVNNNKQSLDYQLTEAEPMHLLIPEQSLLPTLYISRILISQGINVILYGSKDSQLPIISELCLKSSYALNCLAPHTFIFPKTGDQNLLYEMISSALPDTRYSPTFTLRKPFISIVDFQCNENSLASELFRFFVEYDFAYDIKRQMKMVSSGLRFIVTSPKVKLNQRLCHHMYFLNVPEPDNSSQVDTVMRSIGFLWRISTEVNVIAALLIKMWRDNLQVFRFDIRHIFTLIQRVAIVMKTKDKSFLSQAITHESVRVFYDAYHDDTILANINRIVQSLVKVIGGEFINAYDIANNMILLNINSQDFVQINEDSNLKALSSVCSIPQHIDDLMFLTVPNCCMSEEISLQFSMYDPLYRFDVFRLLRILSSPRSHVLILSALDFLPIQLLSHVAFLLGGDYHTKSQNKSLFDCFHDTFIKAGSIQKHQYLYVSLDSINSEEKALLFTLMHNFNVVGLFQRGEMLKLLASIHRKGTDLKDPFNETTIESESSYNMMRNDFLSHCSTYFHWCISDGIPMTCHELLPYVSIFTPYYISENALFMTLKENFLRDYQKPIIGSSIELEMFSEILWDIRNSDYINKIPYYQSFRASQRMVDRFLEFNKILCVTIFHKYNEIIQLQDSIEKMNIFLNTTQNSLNRLSLDLQNLTDENSKSISIMKKIKEEADQQRALLEIETFEIKEKESKAFSIQKQCEHELSNSQRALKNATNELKNLSTRDLSVIKVMNHPPIGVVLVVKAINILLTESGANQWNSTVNIEDDWKKLRKILKDTNLVSNMINRAFDSLIEEEINKLETIVDDPNFDPNIIERSSTAAKSICFFFRAIIPYNHAMDTYKARMKENDDIQEILRGLKEKHEDTVSKMSSLNQESKNAQKKQADITLQLSNLEKQREELKNNLLKYKEMEMFLSPLFEMWKRENSLYFLYTESSAIYLLLKTFMFHLGSNLDNKERQEFLEFNVSITMEKPIGTKSLIKYIDYMNENTNSFSIRKFIIDSDKPFITRFLVFNYPLTISFIETMSYIIPRTRIWCVIEGLSTFPLRIMKALCNVCSFCILSVHDKRFDEAFVDCIKHNDFVLIFDFDYENPKPIVLLAYNSIHSGKPIEYNSESVIVKEDFHVYFHIDSIENHRISGFEPILVRKPKTNAEIREVVALTLFLESDSIRKLKIMDLESQYYNLSTENAELHCHAKELIIRHQNDLFINQELQKSLFSQINRIKITQSKISEAIREYDLIINNEFGMCYLFNEIIDGFSLCNSQELFWYIFEEEFEKLQLFNYKQLLLNILVTFFCRYHLVEATSKLSKVLSIPNSVSFSELFKNVEDKMNHSLLLYKIPSTILEISSPNKPIVIIEDNSSWTTCMISRLILKKSNFLLISARNCYQTVVSSITKEIRIFSIISSKSEYDTLLTSVSFILSSKYTHPAFALYIIVSGNKYSDVINWSLIKSCQIICTDEPSCMNMVLLANIQLLIDSQLSFPLITRISLLDAIINTGQIISFDGHHFSVFSPIFLSRAGDHFSDPLDPVFIEFSLKTMYLSEYPTHFEQICMIWKYVFSQQYPKEFYISCKLASKSKERMNEFLMESGFLFNYIPYGFVHGHSQLYFSRMISSINTPTNNTQLDLSPRSRIESKSSANFWQKNVSITRGISSSSSNFGVSLIQMINHKSHVNLSAFFDPLVFLNLMRSHYSYNNNIDISMVYICIDSSNVGQTVSGIICVGAKLDGDILKIQNGVHTLNQVTLCACQLEDRNVLVPLMYKGRMLTKLCFKQCNSSDLGCIYCQVLDSS